MKRIAMITGALLLAIAVTASAETTTPPPTGRSAYARLSPGNQKIAQALFKAQTSTARATGTGTTTRTRTTTAPKTLTLDEIAAMKTSGQGWGQVFHQMKAQGLVQDKNLGQAIARYNHSTKIARSSSTIVTTASGRSIEVESRRSRAHAEPGEHGPHAQEVGRNDSSHGSQGVSRGGGHR